MAKNTKPVSTAEAVALAIKQVEKDFDADIALYCGNLFPTHDRAFIRMLRRRKNRRKNFLLILVTPGGVAECAYRIAHSIQRLYKTGADEPNRGEFIVYVPEYCKSAGTILTLGADRILMSDFAELGPIDAQLRKEDEVGDWTSGLNGHEALASLGQQSGILFQSAFDRLRSEGFSTRMAVEVATQQTIGLLQPIYSQIDPMRLGETQRFVRISIEYGERLQTANVRKETVEKLVKEYPAHDFVIDREEAQKLFQRVEAPSPVLELAGAKAVRDGADGGALKSEFTARPVMKFLSEEKQDASGTAPAPVAASTANARRRRASKKKSAGRAPAARTNGKTNGAADQPA